MARIRRHAPWILALTGVASLVVSATLWGQQRLFHSRPTIRDAHDLSAVFRQVAKQSLPSIVSIRTETKPVQREIQVPFDEDFPFPEFFRNHPEFRDLFRRWRFRVPPTRGLGSGFIIDSSGWILTNAHVVGDADKIIVKLFRGEEYEAKEVKVDKRSDVAVVRIDADKRLKPIPLGDSDKTEIGDWVLAFGSPFGLEASVTAGIISGKGRGPGIEEREDFLQTDAAINPGNSGGPLVNLNGEVIGINTAISSRSGGYDGVGFAIPINMAKWVAGQLIKKGKVRRAYLGVGIRAVTADIAKQFHTPVGQGAVVYLVTPDSPAAKAGLQPGDVILECAGQEVSGPISLQGIVERLEIGKPYKLVILRDGKRKELTFVPAEMPEDLTTASLMGGPGSQSGTTFDKLGIRVQPIPSDVARSLGINRNDGVLVVEVETGSPAEWAGLQPGDVIQKVGGQQIRSVEDLREALKKSSLEQGIVLIVRNERGTRFVVIQANQ